MSDPVDLTTDSIRGEGESLMMRRKRGLPFQRRDG